MSAGAMTTHRHDETRVSATNTISRATSENSSTVIVLLKAFGENGDGRFLRGRVDSAPSPFSRSKRFEKNQSHYNSLSRSWEASDFPRLSSAWLVAFKSRSFSLVSKKVILYDESATTFRFRRPTRGKVMNEQDESRRDNAEDGRSLTDVSSEYPRENDDENVVGESSPDDPEETDDGEEDAFFSKSFSLNASFDESESRDAAFADGLRSMFESGDDDAESTVEDVSDAERIQRDLELERRESLDSEIRQNDADFLYEAGSRYEAPRATDDDFDGVASGVGAENERRANVCPESILEAMLFVGDRENRPLSLKRACELIRNLSEMEAMEILGDLNERYHREGAPYKIVRDGEGFRLSLLDSYNDIVAQFGGKTKEFKLSQSAIDVLALVAYRQPITLDSILEVRSGAANVLSQLVKRDLVTVEKQTVDKKKISIYRTTDRFLKLFNLKSLDELPVIGDIDYR